VRGGDVSKKILILTTLILVIFAASLAQAAIKPKLFIPINMQQPTMTPTPTPTPLPGVYITTIVYNPPNNYMNEYVTIKNLTHLSIFMEGWTLRDDSKNIYVFPYYILRSGGSINVWTKSGSDTYTDLYWGSPVPIWNDHGDCAYLRDEQDDKVTQYCYSDE
jgi:hypothetical protein